MELEPLGIEGAWLAKSPVWGDERGFFREWFKLPDISKMIGRDFHVQQANISSSAKGTVRGIHYSLAEAGQAKWVTCVTGSIRDVIVDIRPGSPSYGKSVVVELSGASGDAVLISEGLGHGFVSMEDGSTVAYLITSPFSSTDEFEINPLDEDLKINWGLSVTDLIISQKDHVAPTLMDRFMANQLPN